MAARSGFIPAHAPRTGRPAAVALPSPEATGRPIGSVLLSLGSRGVSHVGRRKGDRDGRRPARSSARRIGDATLAVRRGATRRSPRGERVPPTPVNVMRGVTFSRSDATHLATAKVARDRTRPATPSRARELRVQGGATASGSGRRGVVQHLWHHPFSGFRPPVRRPLAPQRPGDGQCIFPFPMPRFSTLRPEAPIRGRFRGGTSEERKLSHSPAGMLLATRSALGENRAATGRSNMRLPPPETRQSRLASLPLRILLCASASPR